MGSSSRRKQPFSINSLAFAENSIRPIANRIARLNLLRMKVWIHQSAFVRNIGCVNYRSNNILNLIASYRANVIDEAFENPE